MRQRITISVVERLSQGAIAWDAVVRGFGVRRQANKRVYLLKARVAGRQRWITIGEHGAPWTPDTARKEAQRVWGLIRGGIDPSRERDKSRTQPTIKALCQRYLEEHAHQHKKPSSAKADQRNIENHVLPLLGKMLVTDLSRSDIDAFKRAVRDGKTSQKPSSRPGHRGGAVVTGGTGVANRCLALLSKMLNLAEQWGWRLDGTNPVRHVQRYSENPKERFLSVDELNSLGRVLDEVEEGGEDTYAIAALRLLIFTGARLGEILTLRWDCVDFANRLLDLPDSKTGRKRIHLSAPAIETLERLPRLSDNPFVIVGRRNGRHLVNLEKPWQRLRSRAGLDDVRIHDLRHSFASIGVMSGLTLPFIGKLLGHKKSITTERYAHFSENPLRAANDLIGQKIESALSGRAPRNFRATEKT
jgi:integrase